MKRVSISEHPGLHRALGYLYEDNVPMTQPEHFWLRDEWDLDRLERFFSQLGDEGGLESELWRFVSPEDGDTVYPERLPAEDAGYAEEVLNSCFEGEDHETWFSWEDVRPVDVQ